MVGRPEHVHLVRVAREAHDAAAVRGEEGAEGEDVRVIPENDSDGFVLLGVYGGFFLGDEELTSFCWNLFCAFEGLEDTTLNGPRQTGKKTAPPLRPPCHKSARVIVRPLLHHPNKAGFRAWRNL